MKDESPALIFPNGTNPHDYIFNSYRVRSGDLYLVRDPLQVLQAAENGVENVVAFLATITAQQLEQLASLWTRRRLRVWNYFKPRYGGVFLYHSVILRVLMTTEPCKKSVSQFAPRRAGHFI